MQINYSLNYVFVVFNALFILNCFAINIEENFTYNSVHKRSLYNNETNMRSSTKPSYKKWQVGRVSRKQYEIINMLSRKTKVFLDVEIVTKSNQLQYINGTGKYKQQQIYTKPTEIPYKSQSMEIDEKAMVLSSTPSFIEFYYFDENDDPVKVKDPIGDTNNFSNENKIKRSSEKLNNICINKPPQSPSITFHANDLNFKHSEFKLENIIKNHNEPRNQYLTTTTKTLSKENTNIESTTAYDKVKFFEIYDSHTLVNPTHHDKYDDFEKSVRAKNIMDHEKVDLINVDQNIGHSNSRNKSRHEKKHITSLPITTTAPPPPTTTTIRPTTTKKHVRGVDNVPKEPLSSIKPNITYEFRDKSALEELIKQTRNSRIANVSRLAYWSSYPFIAVYVYKPTQTHCDAAGISPHWLIAAGACLSRHHAVHSVDARSAFVTYCGESWRDPERIAYVKYSIVHPKFNPRDKAAKYNFNIGLIQVSSSMMSSCTGWAPMALMSHQFAANPEGSMVSAVGWGLDRYGTKYMSKKLPHWPLTAYEGLVFSDSCPGSDIYSTKKRRDGNGNNVFCLLLPPYFGEATDPVHGGLLLDGGKLIAVYLQEERRSSGPQSAQYTGVWRLIPWVLDVAREPEDLDSFPMDI